MTYFLPQLTYCTIVWIHFGKQNAEKLERLNESGHLAFRFKRSYHFLYSYEKLLENINIDSSLGSFYGAILVLKFKHVYSIAILFVYKHRRLTVPFLLIFKFANHGTKEVTVSTAN